jgi:peptidyl-dipeptidase Dcp
MKSTTLCMSLVLVFCGTIGFAQVKKQVVKQTPVAITNPLLQEWKTPYGLPPFDKIKIEHFIPAFKAAMTEQMKNINAIVNNVQKPNFKNTIEAMEKSGALMTKVGLVFYNQLSSNTSDELQKVAEDLAPVLSKHGDDINLNPKLFLKIKTVYENRSAEKLNGEQLRLLEKYYKDFVRSGANLNEKDQNRLREINSQMSLLTLQFSNNVMAETNGFQLVIENKDDLAGLPESVVQMGADDAKSAKMDGKWLYTTKKPSMLPFLTYAKNRSLREKIYNAYLNRGNNNNANDNKKVISQIVKLRLERSNLLGYKTYADYGLETTMAKNADNVMNLLNKLWTPALKVAQLEQEEMQKLAEKEGDKIKIESWDWWYYAEKVRKAKYDLDEEQLRPYFQLENVKKGVFAVAGKLYGLKFIEKKGIPLYHPDAVLYEVREANNALLGVIMLDYYPRASKQNGAWCTGYRTAHYENGKRIIPIVSINLNSNKPTGNDPALLSLDDVETFFHEFGHGIHALVSNCQYEGSTSCPSDFVELPSQLNELWALQPEVLKTYAKHYKTGELIPAELIKKIEASSKFNQGFATVEYLGAAILDMKYHMLTNADNLDVNEFENKTLNEMNILSSIAPRYRSTYYLHIFSSSEYAAGYYSYIWSEVLDTDAFEAFLEKGNIFDSATAKSLRTNILEKGNSVDPQVMYRNFRGRDASIEPLLKKRGLN